MPKSFNELPAGSGKPCFVGSGECLIPAVFSTSDGAGGTVFVCAHHMEEFEAWEKVFSELSPHKMEQLEAAITEQERKL